MSTYPECWSCVIEEDIVIEELHIDESSTKRPSRSNVVREYAVGNNLS